MPTSAADDYVSVLRDIQLSPHAVEPEAQLTRPVADLFEGLSREAGIGVLFLQREAQLEGVRPDFAASIDGRPCGWVELKRPGHSLEGSEWMGREIAQWASLAQLDSLLVCNGEAVRLYRAGEQIGEEAILPSDDGTWDGAPLVALLQLFATMRPPVIRGVHQLAVVLAPMARLLRERVAAGLTDETPRPVIAQAKAVWAANVHEKVTDSQFASDLAQVIAYSLAIAALSGGGDSNDDGFVSLSEARQTLRISNAVLAAALGPVLDIPGLSEELAVEIGAIERLVSVVDSRAIGAAKDNRGEPWLWFYEDFLYAYDPIAREKAGVYYTPVDVVQSQVQHVDFILRKLFSKKLSFADASVVTLDPAAGSGTYPLAVIDQAQKVAIEVRGAAGPKQVVKQLAANVIAFEILPGPYAVAQLRIGRRLADMDNSLFPPGNVRVYLTDTLEDPNVIPVALPLWGDVQVLAEERERARGVKHDQPVTVILGNPPYERGVKADGKWVVNPSSGRSLFDDVIEPAKTAGIIFSAQASLYNHYVYFWRWALWKAFEQEPDSPAVVSFITASSWLSNPVFVGLRGIALEHADEIWVTDLGGEGRGNNAEDNVFAIQTPVAIVTVFRRGKGQKTPATVYYRRVSGKRADKLHELRTLSNPHESPSDWTELAGNATLGFVPIPARTQWETFPNLVDIFPWQQPGVKVNRAWPYATQREVLRKRWDSLLATPNAVARAEKFVTPSSGRNIFTQVSGMQKISELLPGASPRSIVRYAARPFDQQWILNDPRLINLERPALWASLSHQQLFMCSMNTSPLGHGPAITVAVAPPDLHYFRGSFGGKDVIPLYRDATGTPNLPAGLTALLAVTYGYAVAPEDVAAYAFGILAQPGFRELFKSELEVPGARVPFTKDPILFARTRDVGADLIYAQTFGSRLTSRASKDDFSQLFGLTWLKPVTRLHDDSEISYDAPTRTLTVADGELTGVSPDVWEFSVSGWPVVQRWLQNRSALGRGHIRTKPKPLDKIRPTQWIDEWNDELLDLLKALTRTVNLKAEQELLLQEVLQSDLFDVAEFPIPTDAERAEPSH
ncbi:hypothetical protein E3O42_16215 [Cryobacterium adonitolivorans]|uniref:site-specific DNA-methyltransferase (adenine-specific) n=1 Tax=Cryobacterium adonitolivorans TaxID=1259189 RepID=A0A4V3IC25_9MICO|nr:type ISP restriction/modification enzyme [Cryobacterium adonitolivorans]TFB97482.1 hypothetical protein E3O42_16215 [Cryobacterium adonitolivorans]